ncbi:MAG: dynamin family protein [Methylococcaceae bacterium]|nr:dynamin family protein [Methylococcaceae bacterium]
MTNTKFKEQLQVYAQWRETTARAIEQYQSWLERYELSEPTENETLMNILAGLRSDKITLAFAAEFSRGKTELINAMFFSETGVRLLPSTPGRTTMCPTELFYDPDAGSYLRLLSIESRLEEMSIAEFKRNPRSWMQIDLDHHSPTQMQEAFQELIAVKRASVQEARRLALYPEDLDRNASEPPESIEIPCWRHAMISFPHPLLKEGLVILDTPGLNALGTEPELTINMLPSAQAVIFVLAADTGVTKSDLDMWRNHVRGARAGQKSGLAVVMNKIDALWDDLSGEDRIETSIQSQVETTAAILEVDTRVIFPVSAKKALLAKVKSDGSLLKRSRLQSLEAFLSNQVLNERQQLLTHSVSEGVGSMIRDSSRLVSNRLGDLSNQREKLRRMGSENKEMTLQLMTEAREDQSRYLTNVENFQASRRIFLVQANQLVEALDPAKVDEIVKRTKKQMAGSLTTYGMKTSMKTVFDELGERFQDAMDVSQESRRLIKAIYKKFHDGYGFEEIEPQMFSIQKYQIELRQIFSEGEAFRTSTTSTLMEQGLVIQKLYSSIIIKARDVFVKAHREARDWGAAALSPLLRQIKDHKKSIENRLDMLRKINSSKESLESNIAKLEAELLPVQAQFEELMRIEEALKPESPRPLVQEYSEPIYEAAAVH